MAGPDLYGSELVDDPYELPQGYPEIDPPDTALGLVDYYLAPHYLTDLPCRQSVFASVDHMRATGTAVVCLQDGEVHIIEHGLETLMPGEE